MRTALEREHHKEKDPDVQKGVEESRVQISGDTPWEGGRDETDEEDLIEAEERAAWLRRALKEEEDTHRQLKEKVSSISLLLESILREREDPRLPMQSVV